jgi:alkanesulfonate monooxygenase SsuD/methylene tetrahydromethanopterin reductase-like flavin-dependent oxidoreductase (luciferase family)
MVGSADEVMDRIERYREAGARDVELKFICHDTAQLREMIQMLGECATASGRTPGPHMTVRWSARSDT